MDNLKLIRPVGGLQPNVYFVAAWFATSATALIFALILIFYLSSTKVTLPAGGQNFKLFAALPQSEISISDSISHTDARAKIVEDFFKDYKSLLSDYSTLFISVSDKYQLDWRLLPAIAMQESNGGRRVIAGSFNPFGYGIYGNLVIRFASWEDGIEKVGKALREDYLNQGFKTPYEIMVKYTPPSIAKNGAWAKGVTTFMEELR